MGRDYTKYDFFNYEDLIASNLSKRALVFEVVKFFSNYMEYEMNEIKEFFIDDIQGSKGFIRTLDEVKDEKRFSSEKLVSADGIEYVVSNQWGASNFESFLKFNEDQLGYKIIESISSGDETSDREDVLALPEILHLNEFNPDWAEYLTLKYNNSVDCSDEHSRIKINLKTNHIVPINPDSDDSNKKWFGSWDALLSDDNKKNYSSSMLMMFTNDLNDDYGEWRVIWHDIVEGLDDGDYPEGLNDGKLNDIFSGEWFAQIHDFLTQNV